MSSREVVVGAGDNRLTEIEVGGNIDTSLIGEDSSVKFPIGESRAEFWGKVPL